MTCRHMIDDEVLLTFFVGKINSDQTEGRGGMRDHAAFLDHMKAYESIKGEGVMGYGDGDVVVRTIHQCGECPQILTVDETIYHGYKTKRAGFASDGWRLDYSPMMNDPEYPEFLRLQKKFEEKQ